MIVRVSSRHQVTIPKAIAEAFDLKKGDVLDVEKRGHKIIMIPKEVIFEDKYPREDLEMAEEVLSKGSSKKEVSFSSGAEMVRFFKKRIKK